MCVSWVHLREEKKREKGKALIVFGSSRYMWKKDFESTEKWESIEEKKIVRSF